MTVSESADAGIRRSPSEVSADSITPPSDIPLLYEIPETARVIRCGRSTVYELLNAGEIKSIKIGRRRLVVAESVAKFIANRTESVSPASDTKAG